MIRLAYIFFFFLCSFTRIIAQVTERGYVREYNGRLEKKPLAMVEIKVANAGTTTSSEDGSFLIQFRTQKAGDRVSLTRLHKEGYELFNKTSVQQWNISNSGRPFELLMCSSKRFKEIYDRYARVSYESYAKRQKADERKLEEEREAGILRENDYIKKITALREEYNKKLDNIDNYIDRFARIDLTSLTEKEADILEILQKGDIDSAIHLYDELRLEEQLLSCSNKISKNSTVIFRLQKDQKASVEERDSLYQLFLRSLDVLRIVGGMENLSKIGTRMKSVANQDTTFTLAVLSYAQYANEQQLYAECERYAKIAERAYKIRKSDSLLFVYELLGDVEIAKVNYPKALEYYQKELAIVNRAKNNGFDVDSVMVLGNIASLYHHKGKFKRANEMYQMTLNSAYRMAQNDSARNYIIYEMAENNYAIFLRELGYYSRADSIWTSLSNRLKVKYESDSVRYKALLMGIETNLALLRLGQGNNKDVKDMLKWLLSEAQKDVGKTPISSGIQLFLIRNALIDYYYQTKEKGDLQHTVEDMEREYQEMKDYSPNFFMHKLFLTYQHAGSVLINMKEYQIGLNYLQKALEGAYENGNENPIIYSDLKIRVLNALGYACTKINRMDLAETFYLKAINETQKTKMNQDDEFLSGTVFTYVCLGNLYYQQRKYDLSEQYLMRFFEYAQNVPNAKEEYGKELIIALENIMDMSFRKEKTKDALSYALILIDIFEKENNANRLSKCCLSASQILYKMKDKKNARKFWKKAEKASPLYVARHGIALHNLIFKKNGRKKSYSF